MNKHRLADLVLLLVAFIWGITFVLVQNAIDELEPLSFNAIRFMLAAALLSAWLFAFERRQLKLLNKQVIMYGSFIGLWLFVGYAAQTAGLLYTTSSKAGFITGLSVVLVPLLSMIMLRQKPGKNAIIGVIAATLGLFLLTMTGVSSLNKGNALVLICAVGFAFHIIYTGKFSSRFPSLLLSVVQVLTVALLAGMSALLFEDWQTGLSKDVLTSQAVWIALLITSVFATALAFFAQTTFQQYTTATRVALIFAMEPVFAAFAGYYFAGDILTTSALWGCALIFLGMVFAELPNKRTGAKEKENQLEQIEKPGA